MFDFFEVVRRWADSAKAVFTGRTDLWHITTSGLYSQTLGRDGGWLFQTVEADTHSWQVHTADAGYTWNIKTLEVHT